MSDLDQRYRGPSPTHRLLAVVLVVALAASGIAYVGWAFLAQGTPKVQSRLTSYSFPDAHRAVADVVVVRADSYIEATCDLRAVADDHAVVGELSARVADGPAEQSLQLEIRTERLATSIVLLGCTTPEQARPR